MTLTSVADAARGEGAADGGSAEGAEAAPSAKGAAPGPTPVDRAVTMVGSKLFSRNVSGARCGGQPSVVATPTSWP